MLANFLGIVGHSADGGRRDVSEMLDRMPHGDEPEPPLVQSYSNGCVGWRQIVWEDRPLGSAGIFQTDDASLVVLFDGRLDVSQATAAEFGVERWDHHGLIAQGYKRHGEALMSRIEGDFACAVWDRARKRLILARDFAGARPLYWARLTSGGVAFGTSAVAVLRCAGLGFETDRDALWHEALRIYSQTTPNFLKDVTLLPRNRCLVIDEVAGTKDFELVPPASDALRSDDHLILAYREELARAVRMRTAHLPGPKTLTVSGGLDSAAILGATRHVWGPDAEIRAITMVPVGPAKADLPFAREAVTRAKAEWICRDTTLRGLPEHLLPWHSNPYSAASASLAWEATCVTREVGSRSLLVGSGGDYLGGEASNWPWWTYREDGLGRLLRSLANDAPSARCAARTLFGVFLRWHLPQLVPKSRWNPLGADIREALSDTLELFAADPPTRRRLIEELEDYWAALQWPRSSYFEYLHRVFGSCVERELLNWDNHGRCAGVEVAHPFVTPRILHIASSAGVAFRRHAGQGRMLLRRAAADWLPGAILARRGKQLYDEHFVELWRGSLARVQPQRSDQWDRCYSYDALCAAKGSASERGYLFAHEFYGALVLSKWIELNTRMVSGN